MKHPIVRIIVIASVLFSFIATALLAIQQPIAVNGTELMQILESQKMQHRKRDIFKTPLGRLRAVALVEGISYLILLGIAMPLKYFAGFPHAVRVVGSLHGILFILFCMALLHVLFHRRWSILRTSLVFLSSLIPFGTFAIDSKLKAEDKQFRALSH